MTNENKSLATKHGKLTLKIVKNWCSKFIKRFEIQNVQKIVLNQFTEFISCIYFTNAHLKKYQTLDKF